jgi:AraC family transcriptional regulator, positive regulator of tynA and feaB
MVERPTRQRWSTTDVDSRHAMAYWVETICNSFLEIDIESAERHQFRASLQQCGFGPLTRYIVEADSQTIHRTEARIAQSRYQGYFLLRLRAGQFRFEQYGRDALVEPGDCVLIDCNAPYRLECMQPTRSMMLRLSRDWLSNWIPTPQSIVGRPFHASSGWGMALSAALANLDSDDDQELALPEGVVADQIAALLALTAGPNEHISRGSEKLLNRIRRTLRDRFHETGLTPAAIADEHGISKRYLHYLFTQAGSTFGNELMQLRLENAHRLLCDNRFTALSVSEVAARCGFLEPSHFARRFRKAYGTGPSVFRTRQPKDWGIF